MKSTPTSPTQCVPFDQASPQQVSQALLSAQEELQAAFPTLDWLTWSNALLTLQPQPDLWVEGEYVSFDKEGLTRLAHRLIAHLELTGLMALVHGSRSGYLAKKLVNYQDDAIFALAEIEAHPMAYGLQVYRLVTGLAMGNAVAHEVFQATDPGPHGRPGGADPELARAAVADRLQALRNARGAFG